MRTDLQNNLNSNGMKQFYSFQFIFKRNGFFFIYTRELNQMKLKKKYIFQTMSENEIAWTCSFDDVKNLSFKTSDECQDFLHKWALENEFALIKETGTKSYAVYLKCSLSGQPRKFPNAEGKRKKASKKKK